MIKLRDSGELGDTVVLQGGTFRNDAVLLSEAACWAEEARDACGETIPGGLGALPGSPEAAAFAEVSDALAALARLHPFGIEDHELVSISV